MRVRGRHSRPPDTYRTLLISLTAAGFTAALLFLPAGSGASGNADRLTAQAREHALPTGDPTGSNRPFGGVAPIGAVFTGRSGHLGQHYCTASVVDSPGGDLAVSAAHCYDHPGPLVFVPGYDNGAAPYGEWRITKVYTPDAWHATGDPDDDVAFLRLAPAPDGVPVEDVTGAERLGTGSVSHSYVQVVGYPNTMNQPIWCANWTGAFSSTQVQFRCGGYSFGTSGSPFLAAVSGPRDEGTVVGVIGGYQQGGDTSDISYSVTFGSSVASLYRTAVSGR